MRVMSEFWILEEKIRTILVALMEKKQKQELQLLLKNNI